MLASPLAVINRLFNALVTAAYRLRTRPDGTSGAHAIALTPDRKVVLVRLRYAEGWRLPGGGRTNGESVHDAVLRELREEIGMTSHGAIGPSPIEGVMIVEGVNYRPRRWSWEVDAVCEAALDELPADLSARSSAWLKSARAVL